MHSLPHTLTLIAALASVSRGNACLLYLQAQTRACGSGRSQPGQQGRSSRELAPSPGLKRARGQVLQCATQAHTCTCILHQLLGSENASNPLYPLPPKTKHTYADRRNHFITLHACCLGCFAHAALTAAQITGSLVCAPHSHVHNAEVVVVPVQLVPLHPIALVHIQVNHHDPADSTLGGRPAARQMQAQPGTPGVAGVGSALLAVRSHLAQQRRLAAG